MPSLRSAIAAVAALLAGVTATGCGGASGGSHPVGSLEKTHMTIAILPIAADASAWVAQKDGLFAKYGLTVTIKSVQTSTDAYPAMRNGELDVIGGASYVPFIQGLEKHTINFKLIAEAATVSSNLNDVMVMPNSRITSAADLIGKKVAVNLLGNSQQTDLCAILKAQNLPYAKVHFVGIPANEMEAALEEGKVDAADGAEPFVTDAEQKFGAHVVVDGGGQPVTDSPYVGYLTTDTFLKKNPHTAEAFQQAIFAAAGMITQNRKVADDVMPAYTGVSPQVAAIMTLPGFPVSNSPQRVDRMVDLMMDQQLITKPIDPRSFMFLPNTT